MIDGITMVNQPLDLNVYFLSILLFTVHGLYFRNVTMDSCKKQESEHRLQSYKHNESS